ncbi:MAG: hypothetical protein MUD01_21360 [Chloroflexaceae bacterium]|jgi:hypothetical protein|nr:hypothetical protein [Chloroflexaceae bacterium]
MQAKSRNRRWMILGALAGVLMACFLGLSLNLFLALVAPMPGQAAEAIWLVVLRTVAIWGFVGGILGAILGSYASMMWKPKA